MSLIGRVLLAALLLVVAEDARSTTLLSSSSRACLATPSEVCELGLVETGAGAASSIQHSFGNAANVIQVAAGMTLFDYDGFAAGARVSYETDLMDLSQGLTEYATGRATAMLQDSLTVVGGNGLGTVRMLWRITGSTGIGYSSSGPLLDIVAQVSLGVTCFSQTSLEQLPCADPVLAWDASQGVDEIIVVDVPIRFGMPTQFFLTVDLAAEMGFRLSGCSPCEIAFMGATDGDFESTGTLIDVLLLDGEGNPLDESGISSESNFRYDLVGEVPEPDGPMLLAAGALTLAGPALGRRRTRHGAGNDARGARFPESG